MPYLYPHLTDPERERLEDLARDLVDRQFFAVPLAQGYEDPTLDRRSIAAALRAAARLVEAPEPGLPPDEAIWCVATTVIYEAGRLAALSDRLLGTRGPLAPIQTHSQV